MRLQPDQLLVLACVARTGNLTQAGRLLGKTQPAVSMQLKRLATAIGEPLVVRERYGVSLTSAGKALLPAAEALARSVDVAEEVRDRLRGVKIGSLRVLTNTSVATYFLPPVLALFQERHPWIELRVVRHTAEEAVRLLEKGEGDVAIVRGPFRGGAVDFVHRHLLDDETVFAVRPDHPLADRKELTIHDIAGFDMVTQGRTSGTRNLLERLAAEANVSLRIKLEVLSIEAIKEAILQGFGAGCLSRLAIDRELRSGELVGVHIAAQELRRRPVMLLHPPHGQDSPRLRAFLQALSEIQAVSR